MQLNARADSEGAFKVVFKASAKRARAEQISARVHGDTEVISLVHGNEAKRK